MKALRKYLHLVFNPSKYVLRSAPDLYAYAVTLQGRSRDEIEYLNNWLQLYGYGSDIPVDRALAELGRRMEATFLAFEESNRRNATYRFHDPFNNSDQ